MEDKSDIELLNAFARSTNRYISVKEIPYPITGIRTFQKFKRMIYLPNNPEKTSYFIWFSDPYARIGQSTIFSGAYILLPSRVKSRIKIRSKNILDKLKVMSRNSGYKTGNEHFDSKVVVNGGADSGVKRILSQTRIQEEILKALELERYMNVSLNEYKIDFVPELKNKSYLSIINPQSWETERDSIENIFRQVEKIRRNIQQNI